jgi:hypothetical protein
MGVTVAAHRPVDHQGSRTSALGFAFQIRKRIKLHQLRVGTFIEEVESEARRSVGCFVPSSFPRQHRWISCWVAHAMSLSSTSRRVSMSNSERLHRASQGRTGSKQSPEIILAERHRGREAIPGESEAPYPQRPVRRPAVWISLPRMSCSRRPITQAWSHASPPAARVFFRMLLDPTSGHGHRRRRSI